MRVYVAGKLNDMAINYIKNMSVMMAFAEEIRKLGHAVYVPCLDFQMGLMFGDWMYDDYFNNSQQWLKVSDAVFVVPGYETSEGTNREIELAEKLGIPVCYKVKDLQ